MFLIIFLTFGLENSCHKKERDVCLGYLNLGHLKLDEYFDDYLDNGGLKIREEGMQNLNMVTSACHY